jgi:ATP-dependent DNA ligase
MEQEGNKYRTIAGVKGGNLVTSKWTTCGPKNVGRANATTAEEQAEAEVIAHYKKKEKLKYHRKLADVSKKRYIQPMLAQLYKDRKDKMEPLDSGNWLLQCKFNGMRCIATKDGLFTRKGERYVSCPHIEKELKPFFSRYPNAVLDGELFNMSLRQKLNELSKLIRKTVNITPDDLAQSEKMVRFYVYDGYGFNAKLGPEAPYTDRKEWIDSHVTDHGDYLFAVRDRRVRNEAEMEWHYQELLDDNQEGAILRHKEMPYEHKRSPNMLKLKPEDDDEAEIVNIIEGKGNWSGTGKKIVLKWRGQEFEASLKGTQEEAAQFLTDKKKWIGKTVTFLYNGLTGLGTPSFARVDYNNCLQGAK